MSCATNHISRTQLHFRYFLGKDVVSLSQAKKEKKKKKRVNILPALHPSVVIISFGKITPCAKLRSAGIPLLNWYHSCVHKLNMRSKETEADDWIQALPEASMPYQSQSQIVLKFN